MIDCLLRNVTVLPLYLLIRLILLLSVFIAYDLSGHVCEVGPPLILHRLAQLLRTRWFARVPIDVSYYCLLTRAALRLLCVQRRLIDRCSLVIL